MDSLAGEAEAGQRLKAQALRDFQPVPEEMREDPRPGYELRLSPEDTPVPALLKYALKLIGLPSDGPGEKVAWWVDFLYQGEWCQLAHRKFGVRLTLATEASKDDAAKKMGRIVKQLRSSLSVVEKLIEDAAPDLLGAGNATVVNQHSSLRDAYEYFRERALNPAVIADKTTVIEHEGGATGTSFESGAIRMHMNAFHDMVAAITAYFSLVEHVLVLALPFSGFDPANDNLTTIIGWRWGEKFGRLLGTDGDASKYRQRLTEVVERWRNPYSHGGFEKGQGATVYLHTPGVEAAVPIGLTKVANSPLFSLLPTNETDVAEVFDLFDEIDTWLKTTMPRAMQWIDSGLNVRFDETFRSEVGAARTDEEFEYLLERADDHQSMLDNMDF
ncbi:hypothetical protein VA596_46985 [Amycolatopsis sp., V23-08]|uniref:Uncharacterized protein n=1 Tax=Amycolatopsis heterodermiae TaxID=3110235 RepID=A0ABU5RNK3_9PSEU|nr:hypothetical protein [Amycolatopsis sp., V23-08]MEA5367144.1 hypothetical protein [Amycolatopsis sp., V23-08]